MMCAANSTIRGSTWNKELEVRCGRPLCQMRGVQESKRPPYQNNGVTGLRGGETGHKTAIRRGGQNRMIRVAGDSRTG